ncbi:hypothetical protein [Novosphingobium sp.]|jgi:hypothetical protein|uniref:hypothetical protein n=1 Tax=Novosphingobium sp. TaxID=1874826 RepID=UPI0022C45D3C|nr:hypothetical protein [Novosphingobium sp.]MCZ8018667.1 hypothetical protein [Novosphingobium sp.]MCZ8034672.1 hypothetical protein [Novosphingobium sp.]MCZ8052807.1 hypothetical protein [Novosphingobium sp.]MCZ8060565.1 hypothetical protein [Novosphingobium sp.]MCZ8230591.1 hypothetical protein [Novosphingobium sp.]
MENMSLEQSVAVTPVATSFQLSPAVEQYVERYRYYARNTVESILKLGETVLEAEAKLSRLEIMIFCQEVGIDHNGPTFRKLRKIGQQAARFVPVIDRVPNSWTTVYELAKLENDKFETLVNSKALTATATMKELRAFIDDGAKAPSDTVSFTLTVKAKNPAQAVEIDRALGAVGDQFGSKVRVSNQELLDRFMIDALDGFDLDDEFDNLEAA